MRLSLVAALGSVVVVVLLGGAGCGSSSGGGASPGGGDGGDATTSDVASGDDGAAPTDALIVIDTSTADDGEAGPVCNLLANVATTVMINEVASAAPAAMGGSLVAGTYALTSATLYTGTGGQTGSAGSERTTLMLAGATMQVVTAGQPATRTATVSASGTALTTTDSCPDTAVTTGQYTATATTFTLQAATGTGTGARVLAQTYTKQ